MKSLLVMERNKTIVLGLGNSVLGDDGVAVHLVADIQKELHCEDISFRTSELGGLEIMDILRDYKKAVIIDGTKTPAGQPGDVYLMHPDNYRETLHLSNIHDVDFSTALQLSMKLGMPLPEQILIIAIEIEEDKVFSEDLTPVLRKRYGNILQIAMNSVKAEICES
jgi:hydrogenase maturation protease